MIYHTNSGDAAALCARLEQDGFAVIEHVFAGPQIARILADLGRALEAQSDEQGSIRSSGDRIYAARNMMSVWPQVLELTREPPLRAAVRAILGAGCGLVRGLYFDKPPGRSWSLPWHKDMTISVRDNTRPSRLFSKPTTKSGVPHAEAPECVLEQMLTARIHLDDVTDENGPLVVVAGSHRGGKTLEHVASADPRRRTIFAAVGDVLLMRPLVAHSSGNSREDTRRHRRIVHLEFASATPLPDGYDWHDFRPIDHEEAEP